MWVMVSTQQFLSAAALSVSHFPSVPGWVLSIVLQENSVPAWALHELKFLQEICMLQQRIHRGLHCVYLPQSGPLYGLQREFLSPVPWLLPPTHFSLTWMFVLVSHFFSPHFSASPAYLSFPILIKWAFNLQNVQKDCFQECLWSKELLSVSKGRIWHKKNVFLSEKRKWKDYYRILSKIFSHIFQSPITEFS